MFFSLFIALQCIQLAWTAALPYHFQDPGCTNKTLEIRKEWSALSSAERKEFIRSLNCMRLKPSRLPAGVAPGSKNRWDDFIATHINRTMNVHQSGYFLTWHRHFIWLFQKELREECGFHGFIPYWDWPKWAGNLSASPIFDSSETSLSGNGIYNTSAEHPRLGNLSLPKGSGGGCVRSGPFADMTLHFQNFKQNAAIEIATNDDGVLPEGSLDYKPHCFRRDLNDYIATTYTSQAAVDYMIYQSPNISDFQAHADGVSGGAQTTYGIHNGGHYTSGPDLWDFFTSPSDPAFWLHHAMIDLVYSRWQARDRETRLMAVTGTRTFLNRPPSRDVTLDDYQDFGYLAEPIRIRDLMSITAGPYCYSYEYS